MSAKPRKPVSAKARSSSNRGELFRQHQVVARDSLQRLLASPAASGITILVIAVALMLPALLYLFQINLNNGLGQLQQSARVSVFLEPGLSEQQVLEVSDRLQTWNVLSSVEMISSDQAMADFSANAGLADVLASLPENPLPATLILSPVSNAPADLEQLQDDLLALPEVSAVEMDRVWMARLVALGNLAGMLGRALLLFVLLGLFAIIGNTVRLAIESRRDEIQVQKLVGATDGYIARPFLYTGLLLGTAGGAMACLLLLLLWLFLGESARELAALYNNGFRLVNLSLMPVLGLIVLGGGTGWAAAAISSYRNIASINP